MDFKRLDEVINEFKKLMRNVEERDEQRKMMETVYRSMLEGEKAAVHAPTGTGKTFAYILPYIAVKLDNPNYRISIGTFTINLQEQIKKDIELGIQIYDTIKKRHNIPNKRLSYVILKGQKNYFCQKRFGESTEISPEKAAFIQSKIDAKVPLDRQNLNANLSFAEWENVQVDHCLRRQCPFHQNCTYFKDYGGLEEADIVVTNHALFFTRYYFVEPWENIDFFIFDEAHKLEKVLLDTHTFDLSYAKMQRWIEAGEKIALKFGADEELVDEWKRTYFFNNTAVYNAKVYFEVLGRHVREQTAVLEKIGLESVDVQKFVLSLMEWLKEFVTSFKDDLIGDRLMPDGKTPLRDDDAFKEERKGWFKSLQDLREFAKYTLSPENMGLIWLEKNAQDEVSLKVTPKDIKHIDTPFIKGTLLTSGTLAEGRSCASFARRMQLELEHDLCLNSPFMLSEQTMVYVSKNISPKDKDYELKLEREIMELIAAGTQKTFVLFTSNKLMWSMFKKLQGEIRAMPTFNNQRPEIWIQQKENHHDVIASFRNKKVRSILFGTLSYFEGIDLKGDALTQIILTRLPFSVPTHPVQEILDANYGYSQWEAIVRYEQAFGRLIRTSFDFGTFNILDNRVQYMPYFLELFQSENIPITSDIEDIERFYKSQKAVD